MRLMLILAATGAAFAAAAGSGHANGDTASPPPVAPAAEGGCDAAAAEFAVGRSHTPELAEEARTAAGARAVRGLRPGMAVTMEFDPTRLNLVLDRDGTVVRVTCG